MLIMQKTYLDSLAMKGYACPDNFERLRRCEILRKRWGDGSTDCHELDIFPAAEIFSLSRVCQKQTG